MSDWRYRTYALMSDCEVLLSPHKERKAASLKCHALMLHSASIDNIMPNKMCTFVWAKQVGQKTNSHWLKEHAHRVHGHSCICLHLQFVFVRYLRGCCVRSSHSQATTATEARRKFTLPCSYVYCIYSLSLCLSHCTACMLLGELVSAVILSNWRS